MPYLPLTEVLSNDFGRAIQQRGAAYFRGGRVRIESGSALRVVATLRGTSRYRVELQREGEQIQALCTCPYFDNALCKHIWAVIMAAEAQRLLNDGSGNENLHMVPAGVEAQAIDRAHRIGQTQRVFAYRLIARDTIEEKVLALQNAKRDLADAIVGADNSLIRSLAREDLELLLF